MPPFRTAVPVLPALAVALALAIAAAPAVPALAQDSTTSAAPPAGTPASEPDAEGQITVTGAFVRAMGSQAKSGAAYMVIHNAGDQPDRLLSASTDAADRAELHENRTDAKGMTEMAPLSDGLAIPAGGEASLSRGGDHLMLFDLTRPLQAGDTVHLTLMFEQAGEVDVSAQVDNSPMAGMDHGGTEATGDMDHGSMDHGSMDPGTMDHGSMDPGTMDHGNSGAMPGMAPARP